MDNEPVTGDMRTSPWSHLGMYAYEARYTMLSFIGIGPPIMLGYAVWFGYTIVTVLHRQPFPADPRPSDYMYYSMFVGLIGGTAIWFVAMSAGWLLAGLARRVALRVDETGVTLARHPFPPRRAAKVRWEDLSAIVVLPMPGPRIRTRAVALRLKPGASRPPGVPPPGSFRARLMWYPRKPPPADFFLIIRGWELEMDGLVNAQRTHRPVVPIVVLDH